MTIDVVGVNPNGLEEDLRYDYRLIQGGGVQESIAWDERSAASFEVPLCKTILLKLSVGTAYDISKGRTPSSDSSESARAGSRR